MKPLLLLVIIVIALAAGAGAGFVYALRRTIPAQEIVSASESLTALRALRAGDTNKVIGDLEGRLDMSAISLGALLDDHPGDKHARSYTNLLRRIAEYRSAYPHQSEISNVDAAVAVMLDKVKKGNR